MRAFVRAFVGWALIVGWLVFPASVPAADEERDWCAVLAQAEQDLLAQAEQLSTLVDATYAACAAGRRQPACVAARAATDEVALDYHYNGIHALGLRGHCPDEPPDDPPRV
jgi:hypothetical protein